LERDYFVATAAIYVPCFLYPWLRTCFENGFAQKAQITVEENGFTKITIPAKFNWKPGQHCFLRFTSFGIMNAVSGHPFTICSLPSRQSNKPSELVFYLRHQRGLTSKLYQYGLDHPGVSVPVLVDGPYGGVSMQKYYEGDNILVIAGGSGAGWILPFIERFISDGPASTDEEQGQITPTDEKDITITNGSIGGRRASGPLALRVILATRDISSRTWFLQTVNKLVSKISATNPSSSFRLQVYLTGDAAEKVDLTDKDVDAPTSSKASESSANKIHIPGDQDATVPGKEFEGRPHLPQIIQEEAAKVAELGQSLSVYVCGPTTMHNDVRNAVAGANLNIIKGSSTGGVYLHSEHFEWA
jgi:NAD(P)H-flavin reductase